MICVVANKSLFINKQTDVHVSHANCRKKKTLTHIPKVIYVLCNFRAMHVLSGEK